MCGQAQWTIIFLFEGLVLPSRERVRALVVPLLPFAPPSNSLGWNKSWNACAPKLFRRVFRFAQSTSANLSDPWKLNSLSRDGDGIPRLQ